MFKKITVILLLCIYSLSTLGVSLNSFYCCGQLKSVSVTLSHDLQEKCTKTNNSKDCCQTKYQTVKVKDSYVVSDHVSSPAKNFYELNLFSSSSFQTINFLSQRGFIEHKNNAPPLIHGVSSYLFNCIFRI